MKIEHSTSLPTLRVRTLKRLYHGGTWHEPGAVLWLTQGDARAYGKTRVRVLERIAERDVWDRIGLVRERLGI